MKPVIHPGPPPAAGEIILSRDLASRMDLRQGVIDGIADELCGRRWVVEDDRPWLLLCLEEALVNAILHGNEGDPRLIVEVRLYRQDRRWVLTIRDQGEGFSADRIPDPADPASLLLEHGRGITMMSQWLDELAYYHHGAMAWLARAVSEEAAHVD